MKLLKITSLTLVLFLVGLGVFIYSGIYHIGADEPHAKLTYQLITSLRDRSIAVRADDLDVPINLADKSRIRRGAGNYNAMCVGCHLKPGMADSEIRKGLYPQPPNLTSHAVHDPAEAFWVIKHGIKMTGMPAWSKGGMDDATIWDMVALLQELPALSAAEYSALVASSGGHAHTGADSHHEMPAEQPEMAPSSGHEHGTSEPRERESSSEQGHDGATNHMNHSQDGSQTDGIVEQAEEPPAPIDATDLNNDHGSTPHDH